jgi:hypothetical protein
VFLHLRIRKLPLWHGIDRRTQIHNKMVERYNALVQRINGQDTPYNQLVDDWRNQGTRCDNTAQRLLSRDDIWEIDESLYLPKE